MNKSKILFVSLFLGAVLVSSKESKAVMSVFDGWNYTEVTSTITTVFTGAGRVKAIYASSDTSVVTQNWAILVDTPNATPGVPGPGAYRSADRKSPAILFTTSMTVVGNLQSGSQYKAVDYGEEGVLISSAATIWKSAASSGEALKVFLLWRK